MADSFLPVFKDRNQAKPVSNQQANQAGQYAAGMEQFQSLHRHINWSLLIGSAIIFLVVLLAIIGPSIAPRDPMEENVILQINGEWYIPPLPLFTPGFPFGTDDFGRDLYSRVLWGIRPTLVMVTLVATIRLIVGVLIGLMAGWSSGRLVKVLDSLIELALAIPVLLVALCVIAIVGVEFGIWAFILGLAITGWVETAQQVREQTRIVKGQSYIEASRSLGALNRQILLRHVRKQITPLLVMLFAFEMSSTLMTTAGLGFLGYYIGGDVWVAVDDFVARRISGMPELGQMLATSWVTLTKPWVMVVVGSMIFITVLGFNLLGDGLRQNLEIIRVGKRSAIGQFKDRGVAWLDQYVWHPLAQASKLRGVRVGAMSGAAMFILVLVIGFSFLRWFDVIPVAGGDDRSSINGVPADLSIKAPGANETIQETGNPVAGNSKLSNYDPEILWEFEDQSGFNGGVVASNDQEKIYALSKGGTLYAFSLDGKKIWQVSLPAGGVGAPAVASSGAILAADENGGLTRVNRQGQIEWHFQTRAGDHAHSGPILDSKENIYYTVGTMANGFVQSVTAQGTARWVRQANTTSFLRSPKLSADEDFVYLRGNVFSSETGEILSLDSDLKILSYFSGEDHKNYLLSGNNIIQWRPSGKIVEVLDIAEWDTSGLSSSTAPTQYGVTPDGTGWMLYTSPGGSSSLVWVSLEDQTLGKINYEKSNAILVDQNPDKVAYVCGGESFDDRTAECAAFQPGKNEPLWKLDLGNRGQVEGGLWHQGILYVTTSSGMLIAIQETPQQVAQSPAITSLPAGSPSDAPPESGLVWSYTFPEKQLGGILPFNDAQGAWYGLSENLTLTAINPDGTKRYSIQLPKGLYKLYPEEENGYLFPSVLKDGTLIIVSDQNTIYAIGTDGSIKWEQPYNEDVYSWPVETDEGILYILDKKAGLTAVDSNGLRWTFHSPAAANTASGPELGPDGVIYYTVTNLSKGIVQAVTPEGQELWNAIAKTTLFYEPLVVSPDGRYVFLKGDIFDTRTGSMVEYEPPDRVEGIIAGYDGHTYLVTMNSILEWIPGPDGFETGRSVSWDNTKYKNTRPYVQVDKNQVIWLNYYEKLVWLNFDGKVLGEKVPKFVSGSINAYDVPNGRFIECQRDKETETLTCSATTPGGGEPVWKAEVADVPNFHPGQGIIQDGDLYILSESQTFSKYSVGAASK